MTGAKQIVCGVYAIVGASRFLRNLALRDVLATVADELDELGPTRLDGDRASLADVLDEVRTMSLLGDRRLVVVDDADRFISANRASLEKYCGDPAPSGTLVLLCNTLPKNTKLFKIINKTGSVVVCEPPKGRGVVSWIVDRATRVYDKKISPGPAQLLRDQIGDDVGSLDSELSKLAAYVGERSSIAPSDIAALTSHHREEKVFAVTDALALGDTALALAHWEQVLATDRAAPARAIAGLAWGVRRLLEARRAYENGASVFELSRKLYADPDTVRRRLDRVTTFDLERQQRDLLAADVAVKTGATTIERAIEAFIVTHSATRAVACV